MRHVTPHPTPRHAHILTPLPTDDLDAQGSRWGKADAWNKYNMNASSLQPGRRAVDRVRPRGRAAGRAVARQLAKRAIARTSDHLRKLIEDHGDERTMFVIMGDHGHTEPGGAGGAADEVRIVPLFAYQKGSNLGQKGVGADGGGDGGGRLAALRREGARAQRGADYADGGDAGGWVRHPR